MHFVDADFELGLEFRDKIVPYALLWFTGEAMGDEDDDDDDYIPVTYACVCCLLIRLHFSCASCECRPLWLCIESPAYNQCPLFAPFAYLLTAAATVVVIVIFDNPPLHVPILSRILCGRVTTRRTTTTTTKTR